MMPVPSAKPPAEVDGAESQGRAACCGCDPIRDFVEDEFGDEDGEGSLDDGRSRIPRPRRSPRWLDSELEEVLESATPPVSPEGVTARQPTTSSQTDSGPAAQSPKAAGASRIVAEVFESLDEELRFRLRSIERKMDLVVDSLPRRPGGGCSELGAWPQAECGGAARSATTSVQNSAAAAAARRAALSTGGASSGSSFEGQAELRSTAAGVGTPLGWRSGTRSGKVAPMVSYFQAVSEADTCGADEPVLRVPKKKSTVMGATSTWSMGTSASTFRGVFKGKKIAKEQISDPTPLRWNRNSLKVAGIAERLLWRIGVQLTPPSTMEGDEPCGWRVVHSSTFQGVCSLVILLNSFYMGFMANAVLTASIEGEPVSPGWTSAEQAFQIYFILEMVVRLFLERPLLFFVGPEWRWNLFDLSLSILNIFDLTLLSLAKGMGTNLVMVRMLRLLRFFRLTRIMRVARHFSRLRLVLYSLMDSMSSLFWCFVVIFIIVYTFAIFFMTATAEYFEDLSGQPDTTALGLQLWFGGLKISMVTFFMIIAGGVNWGEFLPVIQSASGVYEWLFLFYVFIMYFGVLNVVVGTFAASATEIAARDRDTLVKRELSHMANVTQRIKTFFSEADTDGNKLLTWEEFKEYMRSTQVKAYFHTLDLDVSQAHMLFNLLDADRSGEVSLDEFLDGCLRLKGPARNIDMNVLINAHRRLSDQVNAFIASTQQDNTQIINTLEELFRRKAGATRTTPVV